MNISGHQIARFLDLVNEERQLPHVITCDNGTEYTSKAMFFWSKKAIVEEIMENVKFINRSDIDM